MTNPADETMDEGFPVAAISSFGEKTIHKIEVRKKDAAKGSTHFLFSKALTGFLIKDLAMFDAPRISPFTRSSSAAERPIVGRGKG